MKRTLTTLLAASAIVGATLFASPLSAETLRVGMRSMPPGEGNPYTGRGIPHVFVWTAIYDSLTSIGPGGRIDPDLATSWSNDGKSTWTFKLRPGVTFSNGEPLNAAAVKATFDWLATEKGKASIIGNNMKTLVAGVRVVDDLTVEFTTVTPTPLAAREFAAVHIVGPKAWADMAPEDYAKNPVGTGPYVSEHFKPGDIVVVKRPDQGGTYRPVTGNIDRIEYVELNEGAARVQALLSGQIDLDQAAPIDDFPKLKAAGFVIDSVPAARTLGLSIVSMRNKAAVDGPMANVKVRQALNYAVNKQAIIDNIYGGNGSVASQAAVVGSFGFNPDIKPYSYDPAKAKALLAEAGYANGFDMEIQAITTDATFNLVYQSAVQDINAIGVRANFVSQTFAEWIKHWAAGDWPYDAFGFGHDLSGNLDAGRSFIAFTSCMKDPPYYCNEEEMQLVQDQAKEFDPDKRLKLLQDLLAKNAANAPIIFLTQGIESMAMTPKLKNFRQVNQVLNYQEMVLEK